MTDAEASEWLTVAASELAEYPQDIIASACKRVRRTATHHSAIVPALIADCDEAMQTRRFLARPAPPIPPARQIEPPAPYKPMTQAEVDALPRYLQRIGIACGALVEDDNGNVKPAGN